MPSAVLPARSRAKPIVQPLACGVRGKRQRFPELFDGLVLSGGILVEGLAEIAMTREAFVRRGRPGGAHE